MNHLPRLLFVFLLLVAPRAHAADQMPPPLAALAAKVAPAVVSITALSPTKQDAATDSGSASGDGANGGGGNNGVAPAAVQTMGGTVIPPPQTIEALGSGFIFTPSGYILTNNHVVQGATDATVTLLNGTVYPAVVAGVDPDADLAVLKVNAGSPLPFLTFGDSARMRVGDWVLAVGNPYGMSNSNTAGIVSALHRQIGDTKFDDFIQTDAAINKGNSGGPLLNMQGQVIGVNSAIYAPAGTSDGIGFAIPAAMAASVADALVQNGKMSRGWLGVSTEEISPAIQKALRLPSTKGALVGAVAGNGPAFGKLMPGDVITALGGAAVDDPRALLIRTAELQTGQSVPVAYIRAGATAQATLVITAPLVAQNQAVTVDQNAVVPPLSLPAYGLELSGPAASQGVSVAAATGPAAAAGIAAGDVITLVDGTFVNNTNDFATAVKDLGDNPALFFVIAPVKGNGQSAQGWMAVSPAAKTSAPAKPVAQPKT